MTPVDLVLTMLAVSVGLGLTFALGVESARSARRSSAATLDALTETVAALDRSESENARLRRELALATEQRAAVVDSYRRVKAELEAVRERAG